jgi:hypothetical protein
VQALLHKYETFHRGDVHTVKMPMDRGEGQQWNRAPGNLLSTPRRVTIDPRKTEPIRIALDQVIPPIPDPPTTKYIRHERIQSEKLTKFWGRPMHLGAHVLVPEGFDERPNARYPLVIYHGHFPYTFEGFREEPPDPNLKPDYSERFDWKGYNITQQQLAHQFYKEWTGPNFPRFIIIQIQHANPFYDDSYAVNSQNLGPYGDAINEERGSCTAAPRAGGKPWRRRCSIPTSTTARTRPAPTRSISARSRWSTSTRTRTPTTSTTRGSGRRAPAVATTWDTCPRRSRR